MNFTKTDQRCSRNVRAEATDNDTGAVLIAPAQPAELPKLCARGAELANQDGRRLLGITGAPGAGKSTLAQAIVDRCGATARLVGMDGFHLSQARLKELGRVDRKGAIDTFDGSAFVALLRSLRAGGPQTIYAPVFDRELEESIAGAVAIEPDVRLIVVEGNYLLVPEHPWHELRALLDEVWYCERSEAERLADLIARHRRYGKSEEEARRWALGSDQRNAELVAGTRWRADIVVGLDRLDGEPAAVTGLTSHGH